MKIVKILGGLGNQMFQYAFLIALRKHFDEDILMDIGAFKGYPLHNGFELDRIFTLTANQAKKDDVKRIYHRFIGGYFSYRLYRHLFIKGKNECCEVEAKAYDTSVFEKKSDCYYDGYWQDYRYFENCRNEIKKEFVFKTPLDSKNAHYAQKFSEQLTASFHIRRGDYVTEKTFGGICDIQYYLKAIQVVTSHYPQVVNFAVFSNDRPWCEKYIFPRIPKGINIISVDWNRGLDSYNDLRLMSQCKINVIANSSFSWWGAYLNVHEDSFVVAPQKWTNTNQTAVRQLPTWVLI